MCENLITLFYVLYVHMRSSEDTQMLHMQLAILPTIVSSSTAYYVRLFLVVQINTIYSFYFNFN